MTTPFKPGDRVVVNIPEPVVGVVHCLTIDGAVIVEAAGTTWTLAASEVRPAVPRDRHDLERWGPWWWLFERPVFVKPAVQLMWTTSPGWPYGEAVSPLFGWRGPVARPPKVRS